jgi:hypothetical protein
MPERINKFQPDRTIYLRGFNTFAAAASIHSASPTGFTASGTFRDPADFAVAVLYDVDNYYEHPLIKYLPDFNLAGLTLTFDLQYTDGLQPIDSPKHNWVDWATLDCIRADGATAQVRLFDYAVFAGGDFSAAAATCTVLTAGAGIQPNDRVTLWYQNFAFDYIVPAGQSTVEYQFFAEGNGTVHSITIDGAIFSHTEAAVDGESSLTIATDLISAIASPYVTATAGSVPNAVLLTVNASTAGTAFQVSATDGNATLTMLLTTPAVVAANLANQINATDWATAYPPPYALVATAAGAQIAIATATGGRDGNLIQLYSTNGTPTLTLDQAQIPLTGGSSTATWTCTLDFTALGIDQLRQCWLTFAPSLTNGPYIATEWQATFSNWQLTGPAATQALSVAGPGSVRIEETNGLCTFEGVWNVEAGFYSRYFANATSDMAASVTIAYRCQFTHDLYIGTSLYLDRATVGVTLDSDTQTSLNCYLNTSDAVVARRLLRTSVAAGVHTVTIVMQQAGVFYFDFLEAAVPSDVPDALSPRTNISPALDFDTNHTYQLTPARIMWIMDKLGYAGPMNEYLGVFWWNERVLSGGSLSTVQVTFSGPYTTGDAIFLNLNGTSIGKTILNSIVDTPQVIAQHFADYINGAFPVAWATAAGSTLTVTGRSPSPDYTITLATSTTSTTGTLAATGSGVAGAYGKWNVNDSISPPINRAARDWHADFYAQCAARGREVVTSCSMELVNPPDGYVAQFPDTSAVSTATGYADLLSNQCAVGSTKMLAYQKAVYRCIAQMQAAAGLTPCIQYGEFLWWYFAGPGGMGYYDPETVAAAQTALGRPLHIFLTPNDDPSVNGGADALFLRNRLRDYVAALVADIRAAYSTVICEVLWPYDVNYPATDQLNRFVNLPVEWQLKPSSGLDRIKVEALSFGSSLRNLDQVRQTVDLFPGFGWPLASLKYLVPVFGSATPWARELAVARGAGYAVNNLWAFDHICLFNLAVPEPALERRSIVKAA